MSTDLECRRGSKEIPRELGLSLKTVDVHRTRIMDHLNLNGPLLYAARKRVGQGVTIAVGPKAQESKGANNDPARY